MGIIEDVGASVQNIISSIKGELDRSEEAALAGRIELQRRGEELRRQAEIGTTIPKPPPEPRPGVKVPAGSVIEAVRRGQVAARRPSVVGIIPEKTQRAETRRIEKILEPSTPTVTTVKTPQFGPQIITQERAPLTSILPGPEASIEERMKATEALSILIGQRVAQIPGAIIETPRFARDVIREPVSTGEELVSEVIRDPTQLITIVGAGKAVSAVIPKTPKVKTTRLGSVTKTSIEILSRGEKELIGRGKAKTIFKFPEGAKEVFVEPIFKFKQIETGPITTRGIEAGVVKTTVIEPIVGRFKRVTEIKEPFIGGAEALEVVGGFSFSQARIKTPSGPLIRSFGLIKKTGKIEALSQEFFAGVTRAKASGIDVLGVQKIKVQDIKPFKREPFFTLPSGKKLLKPRPKTAKLDVSSITTGLDVLGVKAIKMAEKPSRRAIKPPIPPKLTFQKLKAKLSVTTTEIEKKRILKKKRKGAQKRGILIETDIATKQKTIQDELVSMNKKISQDFKRATRTIQRQRQGSLLRQKSLEKKVLLNLRPSMFNVGFPTPISFTPSFFGIPKAGKRPRVGKPKGKKRLGKLESMLGKLTPSLTAEFFGLRRKKKVKKDRVFTGLEVRLLPRKKRKRKRTRRKRR